MTRKIGAELGKVLFPGAIVALQGGLGVGKTVFVKGLAAGLGVENAGEVSSPTFAVIQEHRGKGSLCHADLYRLQPAEVRNLGLEEYWREGSEWVTAIEWADKAPDLIPPGDVSEKLLRVQFGIAGDNVRDIIFSGHSKWKTKIHSLKKKFSR